MNHRAEKGEKRGGGVGGRHAFSVSLFISLALSPAPIFRGFRHLLASYCMAMLIRQSYAVRPCCTAMHRAAPGGQPRSSVHAVTLHGYARLPRCTEPSPAVSRGHPCIWSVLCSRSRIGHNHTARGSCRMPTTGGRAARSAALLQSPFNVCLSGWRALTRADLDRV
jgi:hypothetical protein